MEHIFHSVIETTAFVAEVIGVLIIIIALIQAIYRLAVVHKFNFKKAHHDTTLGSGLSFALGVLMIAEIMETVIGATIPGLMTIAALVVVRFMFVLIISFENKMAEAHGHEEKKED